jgi:hypothetical protein
MHRYDVRGMSVDDGTLLLLGAVAVVCGSIVYGMGAALVHARALSAVPTSSPVVVNSSMEGQPCESDPLL